MTTDAAAPTRVPRLSYFFPAHNEEANLEGLVAEALEGLRVESGGAFFSAEMIIKLRAAGRTVVEVGVPHYPRTAGSATGAKPQVVLRAVRDFWLLRLRMWADRGRALRRGEPMVQLQK